MTEVNELKELLFTFMATGLGGVFIWLVVTMHKTSIQLAVASKVMERVEKRMDNHVDRLHELETTIPR